MANTIEHMYLSSYATAIWNNIVASEVLVLLYDPSSQRLSVNESRRFLFTKESRNKAGLFYRRRFFPNILVV